MTDGDAGGSETWALAVRAAILLAVDPGLGGAVVRAGPGPVRDAWLDQLKALSPPAAPWRRLPAGIEDDRLLGGLDLTAALTGTRVVSRGLLAEVDGGTLIAPMAERLEASTAAKVAAAMDCGAVDLAREGLSERLPARFVLIALDESATDEAGCAAALTERLAFSLDLDGVRAREAEPILATWAEIAEARTRLEAVIVDEPAIHALCAAAEALGIGSLRAPSLALRVARANAALEDREDLEPDDLSLAAQLVLAPRATRRPAPPDDAEPPPPEPETEPPEDSTSDPGESEGEPSLDEIVLAAAAAILPAELEAMWTRTERLRAAAPAQGGGGSRQASPRRGRRVGVRTGSPRQGVLDLVATLKASAPWQGVRARADDGTKRLRLGRDDFRIRRFERRAEATVILVVDASGSAAFTRLAETKGAVELLLAEAYVRRTQVGLIAFRGEAAEIVLPPTRSVTRARRQLADLAGGGATPLASALETAAALALAERARGRTPLLVIMTDGRGNVALDGAAFRTRAETEAHSAAVRIRAAGLTSAVIDVSPRPRGDAERLAELMGARFAVLPRVQAGAVRDLVRDLQPAA
jgi:magnesium chelatase subunit D